MITKILLFIVISSSAATVALQWTEIQSLKSERQASDKRYSDEIAQLKHDLLASKVAEEAEAAALTRNLKKDFGATVDSMNALAPDYHQTPHWPEGKQ